MSRRDLLRWQFDLTWSLFEYHLERLQPADLWWEPTGHSWTVRQAADGTWRADWAETEPDPVPTPTIAWLCWHLGWWWTATIEHAHGRSAPRPETLAWPGDGAAVIAWLRDLRRQWLSVLDRYTDTDLDGPTSFPWQDDAEKTMAHTCAWVDAELMKNVTEIGQLRMLRAVGEPRSPVRGSA